MNAHARRRGWPPRRRAAIGAALALAAAWAVALLAGAPPAAAATWCGGTAESATDRPDTVPALSWHVVYAYPSDGVDRFPQLVGPMLADLSAIDAWWTGQDATRAIRWDLAAFPDCGGGVAALDLSSVRLAHDASWFRGAAADRYARVIADVVAAGFGDADKKLLVWYDGPLDQPLRECGISRTGFPLTGGADGYALVYLQAGCGDGLGSGVFPAVAAVHEMTHAMDALAPPVPGQPSAPHACPGDSGHPCDSKDDLLYPSSGAGVTLAQKVLDVGHDDYYGHSGPWFDVRNSPFLDHRDSPDKAAPGAPGGITAVSSAPGTVELRWQAAPDDVGPVTYEVWRDGALAALTPTLAYGEAAPDGATHAYLVRARDAEGYVGPGVTLRYTGGLGIVDASGALLKDTVPPSPVVAIRARLTAKGLFLTWLPATDPGGVAGYRVLRDGTRVATARGPAFSLPADRAVGRWTVQPFDRGGNLGPVSPAVTVTAAPRQRRARVVLPRASLRPLGRPA